MLRLSEAIRLGSMLHPQGFNRLRAVIDNQMHTCALGAAEDAGYTYLDDAYAGCDLMCPACALQDLDIENVITHLNDYHQWTREAIADWIETTIEKETHAPTDTLLEPTLA